MLHNLNNQKEADEAFQFITSEAARGSTVEIKIVKPHNQRTLRQNSALHLCFGQLADQLNSAGFDMKRTLKPGVEIPWTAELVKEHLWRTLQQAVTGKVSTTQLTSSEIDKVFEILAKHLGETTGLEIYFPSIETLLNGKR